MEFKEFRVGDLFEQERGKEKAPNQAEPGDCQLVNETSTNNGWTKLVKPTKRFAGNAITISINFASTVFYQPKEFCASVNIAILRNKWLNYKRALYIVTLLKKQFVIYDYNNKISKDKINDTKISLPVTPSGEIDFNYMEQYIEKIEKQYIEKIEKQYIEKIALMLKASGLDNYQLTEEEKAVLKEEKEKKEFKIDELWVVDDWVYGKDKKWKTQFDRPVEGSLPVISGQTTNNGVKYYTSDNYLANEVFEDCLTMTTRGESGRVFYHPGKFLLANNVLVMKMPKYSKNVMLYLGTVIEKVCRSTNYSVYPTKDSLKTKTIFLPVTPTEEIDFDYMEKYISAIIKTKIKNVVLEINKKLELYKQTQN